MEKVQTSQTRFKKRLDNYKKVRIDKLENKILYIPFKPYLPRFSNIIHGLSRESYWIVTADTNVGKTPFVKDLFINIPIDFVLKNKGLNLKILYFALEESSEAFIDKLVANTYSIKYKESMSADLLNGISERCLTNHELNKLESIDQDLETKLSFIQIIDNLENVDSIIKYINTFALSRGTISEEGYIPNDLNEFVIVIVDHVNLLEGTNMKRTDAMSIWGSYCLHTIVKKYKYCLCNIQQQSAETAGLEAAKITNNEASRAGLGDNKSLARDAHVIIGLNNPNKQHATSNKFSIFGYPSDIMVKQYIRYINIIKNRFGPPDGRMPLEFSPSFGTFREYPLPKNLTNINFTNYV